MTGEIALNRCRLPRGRGEGNRAGAVRAMEANPMGSPRWRFGAKRKAKKVRLLASAAPRPFPANGYLNYRGLT